MKTLIGTLLATAALGLGAVSAQEPATLAEATEGPSNIALWRTGDADTTIYLFGTVHILQPGIEWETSYFTTAWNASDAVYFEADVTSPEALAEAQGSVMASGFFTDGRTLAGLFTEQEAAVINAGLAKFGFDLAALGNMRPWLASLQLAQIAMQQAGGTAEGGMEFILAARAAKDGLEPRFFETVTEQVQMIASIPDEEYADSLVDSIDELDDIEGFFARLIGAWYRGDADRVAEILNESMEATPKLADVLLTQRNARWAGTLDEVIKTETGTYFVAVGAGHLSGTDSVAEMLSEKGYEITRVNP